MGGYRASMAKYATFEGRASRSEFWQFSLVVWLVVLAAYFFIWPLMHPGPGPVSVWGHAGFVLLFSSFHILPSAAVLVRRLHDLNLSGWWALFGLVPFIGFLMFVPAAFAGTKGPNRFGPRPEGHAAGKRSSEIQQTAAPANTGPSSDIIGQLERLSSMRASGALSDAELEALKSRLTTGGFRQ